MKWFFVILLLGNLVFFGWSYRHALLQDEANAGYGLAAVQAPERLSLLPELDTPLPLAADGLPEEVAAPEGGEDSSDPEPESEPESESGPDLDAPEPAAVAQERRPGWPPEWADIPAAADACMRFGPFFEESTVERLQGWLGGNEVPNRRRVEQRPNRSYYWIYIAPRKSLAALAETIEDLKAKGIGDYRLVSRGNLKNALSLGVFSDRAKLDRRLEELREQGYRPIIVPYGGEQPATWVYARFDPPAREDGELLASAPFSRGEGSVIECGAADLP